MRGQFILSRMSTAQPEPGIVLNHRVERSIELGPPRVLPKNHTDSGSASRLGYFVSEYIWGNFILAFALLGALLPRSCQAYSGKSLFICMAKRTIDITGALVGLILSAPLFLVLPILIKLDSPGPVFYRQARVGYNRRKRGRRTGVAGSQLGRVARDRRRQNLKGRPFEVIKFRTMVADAERKCGPVWATRNDPRITRLGRVLRKARLDEVPQFINVLKGEMSLVGPRPERPHFVAEFSQQVEDYDLRLEVKPGITGLAQVENGYDSSMASVVRKVHFDLQYIKRLSLWGDIKILMRTIVVVVTGKGAF